ncbi:LysM peptidoglycan-binding domain-containing protein [Vibrio astriarenae]
MTFPTFATLFEKDDLQLGISGLYALKEGTEENADFSSLYGAELFLGYEVAESWLVEGGLRAIEDHNNIYVTRFKTSWDTSDSSELYLGGGFGLSKDSVYPTINVGVLYKLNDSLLLDVGYEASFETRNIYSLLVSLKYGFSNNQLPKKYQMESKFEQKQEKNVGAQKVFLEEECTKFIQDAYLVEKGDWLSKIARKLNLSLHDLIAQNPKFKANDRNIDLIYPNERVVFEKRIDNCL